MVDVKLVALQAGTFGRRFASRFAPLTFVVAVAAEPAGRRAGCCDLGGRRRRHPPGRRDHASARAHRRLQALRAARHGTTSGDRRARARAARRGDRRTSPTGRCAAVRRRGPERPRPRSRRRAGLAPPRPDRDAAAGGAPALRSYGVDRGPTIDVRALGVFERPSRDPAPNPMTLLKYSQAPSTGTARASRGRSSSPASHRSEEGLPPGRYRSPAARPTPHPWWSGSSASRDPPLPITGSRSRGSSSAGGEELPELPATASSR